MPSAARRRRASRAGRSRPMVVGHGATTRVKPLTLASSVPASTVTSSSRAPLGSPADRGRARRSSGTCWWRLPPSDVQDLDSATNHAERRHISRAIASGQRPIRARLRPDRPGSCGMGGRQRPRRVGSGPPGQYEPIEAVEQPLGIAVRIDQHGPRPARGSVRGTHAARRSRASAASARSRYRRAVIAIRGRRAEPLTTGRSYVGVPSRYPLG